jgi:hypothetical protein
LKRTWSAATRAPPESRALPPGLRPRRSRRDEAPDCAPSAPRRRREGASRRISCG